MAKDKENEAGKDKAGAEGAAPAAPAAKVEPPPPPPVAPRIQLLRRLEEEVAVLEKAVASVDLVLVVRAARYINTLRRYVRAATLHRLLNRALPAGADRDRLLAALAQVGTEEPLVWPVVPAKKPEEGAAAASAASGAAAAAEGSTSSDSAMDGSERPLWEGLEGDDQLVPLPAGGRQKPSAEVVFYLHLLVALRLLDAGRAREAFVQLEELARSVPVLNRRTLDPLAAKAYSFYALAAERVGRTADDDLPVLLRAHRTACLHHDEPSQVVLINAILRLHVRASQFAQADRFRLSIPAVNSASPAQNARLLLYKGRIDAIQLHYSDAHENLSEALRKGPQRGAVGFRAEAQKLQVIVQLLMGEVPERALFRDADLKRHLAPYYKLTHAVYTGDLGAFGAVMRQFERDFARDRNYSLIVRLRQNVIKTGLRKICTSYSRISVADVVAKLRLESREAAEFVIAKAIRDNVIDGQLDHAAGVLVSRESTEVYHTQEPQQAFHRRIQFCMDIHNEAVKALRFPTATAPTARTDEVGDAEDGGGMFMDIGDD